jgi:hypothetical protein
MMQANSSHNPREAEASQNMADSTLSPNSRLEDGEVVDITKLTTQGHGIAQDVEDILDADHMLPRVVNDEELPLNKQGPKHLNHPCVRTPV